MRAVPAHAALGGSADSIESDRKNMSGVRRAAVSHTGYTVHEVVNSGLTVREYLSSSGVVFGLAWRGITAPDMTTYFGNYAAEYSEAVAKQVATPGRKNQRRIQSQNLVVKKFGHMRALGGVAYVTALIPEGVSPDDIQ